MRRSRPSRSNEFELERYKYLLQEMRGLNENVHRFLTLFQALVSAIIGGGVAVFVSWRNLGIPLSTAKLAIRALEGGLVLAGASVCVFMIVSISSWLDYRTEEVKLLDEMIKPGFREHPTVKNLWRWSETWLFAFVVLTVVGILVFAETQFLPALH